MNHLNNYEYFVVSRVISMDKILQTLKNGKLVMSGGRVEITYLSDDVLDIVSVLMFE